MTELFRTILGDLLGGEPDIVVVGSSAPGGDCLRDARCTNADVILAQDSVRAGGSCLDLVLADQPLGVLAVSIDGHSASGVSLRRRPIVLDSDSPSILAGAIRRMARELDPPSAAAGPSGLAEAAPANPIRSSAGNGGESP
jgi:chemotaxis response regulator CheB